MERISIDENIRSLLHFVPCVTEEQLEIFFGSDERMLTETRFRIRRLEERGTILRQILSDGTAIFTGKIIPDYSESALLEFVEAFWIVANFGAENIDLVHQGDSYTRLFFYEKREDLAGKLDCYDVTVCSDLGRAIASSNVRTYMSPGEKMEKYYHIALVPDEETGEAWKENLEKLGYSDYAWRTEDNRIIYRKLDRG